MTYRFETMDTHYLSEFVRNIREDDLAEIKAQGESLVSSVGVFKGMLKYAHLPEMFMALLTESGKVMAIGGILPIEGTLGGSPWFLCTNEATKNPLALFKGLLEKATLWETMYEFQSHTLWFHNIMHVRLVKRLGYTIHPDVDSQGFVNFSKGV